MSPSLAACHPPPIAEWCHTRLNEWSRKSGKFARSAAGKGEGPGPGSTARWIRSIPSFPVPEWPNNALFTMQGST
jgi:hypothetical protein